MLVCGASSLGCEVLKNLALSGFRTIDVIDKGVIKESDLAR